MLKNWLSHIYYTYHEFYYKFFIILLVSKNFENIDFLENPDFFDDPENFQILSGLVPTMYKTT